LRIIRIADSTDDENDHGGRKPYKIFILAHGEETYCGTLWAFSSEQARGGAISRSLRLQDALEMKYEVIARLDEERWKDIEEFRLNKEKRKEEQVQNAWWNK